MWPRSSIPRVSTMLRKMASRSSRSSPASFTSDSEPTGSASLAIAMRKTPGIGGRAQLYRSGLPGRCGGTPRVVPVAIVTGSDSGIGKATAVALAREGYDIGITWHEDEEGARHTVSEVEGQGGRAALRRLDLARLPDAAGVIDELADELGGVDVLVNNAGTSRQAPFLELAYEDWLHTLDVDLNGAFLCGQRAARRMVA